jgi:hypothetical protein
MLYGSSMNIEAAQSQYCKAYTGSIPKQNPDAHDHPSSLSEAAEKEKQAYDNSKIVPVYYYIINSLKMTLIELNSYVQIGVADKLTYYPVIIIKLVISIQVFGNLVHIM